MTTAPTEYNHAWMPLNEAAIYLGTSRRTLERAVAANRIPHTRDPLTGRVRFHRDALDEWMVRGGRRAR